MQEKQSKKCNVKNQHYVPQFYLKNFSKDKKNIGAFVIENCKYVASASIKHQSSEDYFYSENPDIERDLGALERNAKIVIDTISGNPKVKLNSKNAYTLYLFTMIQQGRTLANANFAQNHINATTREIIKIKNKIGDTEETEGVDNYDIDGHNLKIEHPARLSLAAQAALANTCIDLHRKIIINNTQKPFITSDNPVAIYNTFIERMNTGMYSLASRGLQIFLPLNPSLALFLYDPKCYKIGRRKDSFIELNNRSDINELNRLTVLNAERTLYFEQDSIKESELSALVNENEKYRVGQSVGAFRKRIEEDKIAIVTYHLPILCKLSLSFIKELPAYKALKPTEFNHDKHCYREIAYHRNEIIEATIGKQFFQEIFKQR